MRLRINEAKDFVRNLTWKRFGLIYSAIFLCLCVMAFFPFIANGKSFVGYPDGIAQHYNALRYLGIWGRDIIQEFISSGTLAIPLWDFGIGYGSDILTTLNYYGLGDPLAILTIVVPARYTEYLYIALIILRLYLAGICFALYCRAMGKTPTATLVGTVVYVFCGWGLYATLRHPFFANPMLYLPLLLLGVEKVLRDRNPILFIVMVAISLISNFYFAYMLILMAILYTAVRAIALFQVNRMRQIIVHIGKFCLYGAVGALLAGIIFLPILLAFLNTGRSSVDTLIEPLYSPSDYGRILAAFVSPTYSGHWIVLGFSGPALLGLFALLGTKHEHGQLKVGLGILTAFVFLPAAASALNGFSYAASRWLWAYSMLVAFIFTTMWDSILSPSPRQKAFMVVGSIAYCALVTVSNQSVPEGTLASIAVLLIALVVIMAGSSSISRSAQAAPGALSITGLCVCAIVCVGIGVNSCYTYDWTHSSHISDFLDIGTANTIVRNTPAKDAKQLMKSDDSFSRLDTNDYSAAQGSVPNSSNVYGVSSTNYYWSLSNAAISNYLIEAALPSIRSFWYNGLDQRTFLNALASVKYYAAKQGTEGCLPYGYSEIQNGKHGTTLYQNDYALPLGYTYSSYISEDDWLQLNPIQQQEAALSSVALSSSAETPTITQHYAPASQSVNYEVRTTDDVLDLGNNSFMVGSDNATITLSFSGLPNSETYLYVPNISVEQKTKLGLYLDSEERLLPQAAYEKLSVLEQNKLINHDANIDGWSNTNYVIQVDTDLSRKTLQYKTPFYSWYDGQTEFLVNAGYSTRPLKELTITFPTTGIYHLNDMTIVCQPMDDYEAKIDALTEDTLEGEALSTNHVAGTISLSKRKVLCLSIPYAEGWTATVDGKPATIQRANGMFMALQLEPGKHTIDLTYETPGLKAGCVASICGTIALVAMALIVRKRARGQAS